MILAYDVIQPPGDKQLNLPPVLMLHGMIDFRGTWKHIAPKIAENTGRIVYVVDARNHGESPWSEEMDWVVLAKDIEDFLVQHGIPKAVLVGHSMGGRASFTLALQRPDMVEKLVVEDIAVRTIRPKDGDIIVTLISLLQDALNAIPPGADELTAKTAIVDYVKALLPKSPDSSPSKIDMDLIPLKKEGESYRWLANLDALEDFLTTEKLIHDVTKLGVYNGDALFLYGTKSGFGVNKDPVIPKLFPRAVRIPFEGGTHLLHHEYPKKYTSLLIDFINKGCIPSSKI